MCSISLCIMGVLFSNFAEAGIESPKDILLKDRHQLAQAVGIPDGQVKALIDEASHFLIKDKLKTAFELPKWPCLSTGCAEINSVLRGGIPANGIVEIYGQSGVGKTQFCLQLALMVQMPKELGGFAKGAVYICTEDIFPSKRLHQLAQLFPLRFNADTNFEDNIFVEHAADFEQLRRCICVRLPRLMHRKNIGLIVIDSVAGPFRSDNVAVNYAARSEKFITLATCLKDICEKYQAVVICVNQVTDNLKTGVEEPCMGLAWSNLVASRFQLAKICDSKIRKFEIVFSPDLPQKSCQFLLDEVGIIDI